MFYCSTFRNYHKVKKKNEVSTVTQNPKYWFTIFFLYSRKKSKFNPNGNSIRKELDADKQLIFFSRDKSGPTKKILKN